MKIIFKVKIFSFLSAVWLVHSVAYASQQDVGITSLKLMLNAEKFSDVQSEQAVDLLQQYYDLHKQQSCLGDAKIATLDSTVYNPENPYFMPNFVGTFVGFPSEVTEIADLETKKAEILNNAVATIKEQSGSKSASACLINTRSALVLALRDRALSSDTPEWTRKYRDCVLRQLSIKSEYGIPEASYDSCTHNSAIRNEFLPEPCNPSMYSFEEQKALLLNQAAVDLYTKSSSLSKQDCLLLMPPCLNAIQNDLEKAQMLAQIHQKSLIAWLPSYKKGTEQWLVDFKKNYKELDKKR